MDSTGLSQSASMIHSRQTASPANGNSVSQHPPPSRDVEQKELRLTAPPFTTPCTRPTRSHGDENIDPTPIKKLRTSSPPSRPTPGGNVANTKRPDTPRKSPSNGLPFRYEVLVPRRGQDTNWTREQFRAYLRDRFQKENMALQGHSNGVDSAYTPSAL